MCIFHFRWKYHELLFVLRAKYLMCLSGLPARWVSGSIYVLMCDLQLWVLFTWNASLLRYGKHEFTSLIHFSVTRVWSVSLTLMVQLLWWTWLEQIGCLRDPTVPGIPSAWMQRWSLKMNLSCGFSRHWHQVSLLTARSAGKAGARSSCLKRGLKVGGDHHEGMTLCSRGRRPRIGTKAIRQGLVNVNRLTTLWM